MNSIKFCADINETTLPFITVTEGTFKGLCFLLDTGSTDNILFKTAIERFAKHIILTDDEGCLSGIEGNSNVVPVVKAELTFHGVENRTSFLLVEENNTINKMSDCFGFTIAGIIGASFMLRHRWVIDIVAQEVTIRPRLILDCA